MHEKIALFDFLPNFCPGCGKHFKWTRNMEKRGSSVSDWEGGASHSCDCGVGYQKVNTKTALSIADDLAYYVGIQRG